MSTTSRRASDTIIIALPTIAPRTRSRTGRIRLLHKRCENPVTQVTMEHVETSTGQTHYADGLRVLVSTHPL